MKRKILFEDVAVNISMLALFIVSILLILLTNKLNYINKLNNGYYSKNKETFSWNKEISSYEDIINLYSKCESNTILYKEMSKHEDLRGILLKGDVDKPPIIEGRFFNENDFYKGNYYAVIGGNQKNRVYVKENNQYIDIGGHPYEVIGTLGTNEENGLLDYSIFVNLDSFSEINNNIGLYHLDGKNKRTIQQSLENLKSDITSINLNKYGIINIVLGDIQSFSVIICIFITFMMFYLFFSYSWFCSNKKLLNVMTIIGVNNIKKINNILVLYLKIISPTVSIIIISLIILINQNILHR